MADSNDEIYAREAGQASLKRQSLHDAKIALAPYLNEAYQAVDKIRGQAHVIARRHGVPPLKLWAWVIDELCGGDD